ncbi:unnamed protein product [Closterium sp. Naga37s-1]|nr:unnamed protein product [Closterium sp. Naga37s-1]
MGDEGCDDASASLLLHESEPEWAQGGHGERPRRHHRPVRLPRAPIPAVRVTSLPRAPVPTSLQALPPVSPVPLLSVPSPRLPLPSLPPPFPSHCLPFPNPSFSLSTVVANAAAAAGEGTGPMQADLSFLPGGALSFVPIACYCYARPCRLSPHSVLLVRSAGTDAPPEAGGGACGSLALNRVASHVFTIAALHPCSPQPHLLNPLPPVLIIPPLLILPLSRPPPFQHVLTFLLYTPPLLLPPSPARPGSIAAAHERMWAHLLPLFLMGLKPPFPSLSPLPPLPPSPPPPPVSLLEMNACGPSHSLPLPQLAMQRLQHLLQH